MAWKEGIHPQKLSMGFAQHEKTLVGSSVFLEEYSDSLDLYPEVSRALPCASISTPRRTVLTARPGNVSRASQPRKDWAGRLGSGPSEA